MAGLNTVCWTSLSETSTFKKFCFTSDRMINCLCILPLEVVIKVGWTSGECSQEVSVIIWGLNTAKLELEHIFCYVLNVSNTDVPPADLTTHFLQPMWLTVVWLKRYVWTALDTNVWAVFVMAALRSRCGHYIFILWFLLSSSFSFFPRLISAVGDWMSTILPHMVWP